MHKKSKFFKKASQICWLSIKIFDAWTRKKVEIAAVVSGLYLMFKDKSYSFICLKIHHSI